MVNTPNFRTTTPPRLQGGKEGERGRGGRGKGRREEKGREGTPKGWLTPPMFQILKNTLVTTTLLKFTTWKSLGRKNWEVFGRNWYVFLRYCVHITSSIILYLCANYVPNLTIELLISTPRVLQAGALGLYLSGNDCDLAESEPDRHCKSARH